MGNSPQTPSRLTIRFAVNGFPCELAMDVNAADFGGRLDQAVQIITTAGGVPMTNAAPLALPAQAVPAGTSAAIPRCPFHGPMKESTKRPGTYFCPSKMGDGESYCKEKFPA